MEGLHEVFCDIRKWKTHIDPDLFDQIFIRKRTVVIDSMSELCEAVFPERHPGSHGVSAEFYKEVADGGQAFKHVVRLSGAAASLDQFRIFGVREYDGRSVVIVLDLGCNDPCN